MYNCRFPVHLITGFLGSGKTTLLRRLLTTTHGLSDTAVIVNEFGEVGLDHLLVKEVAEDVILMASGCLCCTVKDDLISTLVDLYNQAESGTIPLFSRVVVETTGVADPLPVAEAILVDSQLSRRYRLGRITTTVDAQCGSSTLLEHATAVRQISAADMLIVTKTDLVNDQTLDQLHQSLVTLNPSAKRLTADRENAPGSETILQHVELTEHVELVQQLKERQTQYLGEHTHGIDTFVVEFGAIRNWDDFVDWLDILLWARGSSIYRVKGWVYTQMLNAPILVQAVQHTVFPAEKLHYYPEGKLGRSKLIFISRHVSQSAITSAIQSVTHA